MVRDFDSGVGNVASLYLTCRMFFHAISSLFCRIWWLAISRFGAMGLGANEAATASFSGSCIFFGFGGKLTTERPK
jgi:hypothetical protein